MLEIARPGSSHDLHSPVSGVVPDRRHVGKSIHQGADDQERTGKLEGTYQPRAALESDRRESAVVRNCMFAV